jgi:hypothetical protein
MGANVCHPNEYTRIGCAVGARLADEMISPLFFRVYICLPLHAANTKRQSLRLNMDGIGNSTLTVLKFQTAAVQLQKLPPYCMS